VVGQQQNLKEQDQEIGLGKRGLEGQLQVGNAKGTGANKGDNRAGDINRFGEFVDLIYYNCRTHGHHKAGCKKLKICFMCKKDSHVVDMCPVKKHKHRCAKYIRSAANGLGFYNIEVTNVSEEPSIDFINCGKIYIETGDITLEELQLELATCFNPYWPWEIRQIKE
jgi:hypothetical protein